MLLQIAVVKSFFAFVSFDILHTSVAYFVVPTVVRYVFVGSTELFIILVVVAHCATYCKIGPFIVTVP